MTKEAFLALLDRQRGSGMGTKAFCRDTGCSFSSFQYWRKKFCSDQPHAETGPGTNTVSRSEAKDIADTFAPVSFPVTEGRYNSSSEQAQLSNEIVIEFPTGVMIYFRGATNERAAMGLINRIYTGDVLP